MPRLLFITTALFACTVAFSQSPAKKTANIFTAARLTFTIADTMNGAGFYEEVSFSEGAAGKVTSVTAIQFEKGTLGFAVEKGNIRTIVFNVNGADTEKGVHVVLLKAKGHNVKETHGKTKWNYNWKDDSTYRFYLNKLIDSAASIYTAYFFIPEVQKWKLLASFAVSNDSNTIREISAAVEFNKIPSTTNNSKVYFSNQWIQRLNGEYREVTESMFSKITKNDKPANNLVAGVEGDKLYLAKAPDGIAIKQRSELTRPSKNVKPVIDVTKNVDSIIQWKMDKADILQAIKAGKFDTTGSKYGVYYLLLKQGTGADVAMTDTVTVYYRGSLLKDGSMFDETKTDPVTFPLNRLIRGWQVGVSLLKVGGKIRLIIPSAMGYSIRSRSKDIPPNSILVFDVEVVAAKKAIKI